MPSQFFGLNIGASALSTYQISINTTANNIANVQTKGYTRQTTNLGATPAMRVYAKYGSAGTGVEAISITQERDYYYDTKYWENCSSLGSFEQKLYYLSQIETVFADDSVQQGFSTIFNKMFNGLDTLKTNASDVNVRNQFVNQAQSLCTYFNALSTSLKEIQDDCNAEIKNSVDNINSIAEKISLLNKEINALEMRGGHANELRDERAVLVDELSMIVNVETAEFEVHNSYGQNLGGTNYRVIINGQVLVEGNDFRQLECIADEYPKNATDTEGLYSIIWKDTKTNFAATTGTAGGSLKALFEVRDGNNNDILQGTVAEAQGQILKIESPSITNINSLNIPREGTVMVNNRYFTYSGWEATVADDGSIVDYTFHLTEEIDPAVAAILPGETMTNTDAIDAMGVPYYQQQINEFLRNFTKAFNDIQKTGVTLDGEQMGAFFVGETAGDNLWTFEDWVADDTGSYARTITCEDDTYYRLNAANIAVNPQSLSNPRYFSTTVSVVNGMDAYDLVQNMMDLQNKVILFRGDKASSFLETLISDVSVDTERTEIYYTNYYNLEKSIGNQRTSVSGVDEDEEALNLIKFQNAYNMSSKVISVMQEIYDKLINETGVT